MGREWENERKQLMLFKLLNDFGQKPWQRCVGAFGDKMACSVDEQKN